MIVPMMLTAAFGLQSPSTPGPGGPGPTVPGSPGPAAQAAATNVVKAYDLRALRTSSVQPPERTFRMVPQGMDWILRLRDEYDASHGEESELFFPSLLADLLGDELSFEGRSLKILDDGTLLLIGPADLHAKVSKIYDFFEQVAMERVVLSVEVGGDGATSKQLVSLPSAVWSQVRVTETVPIMGDVDVEIAQACAISDPIVFGVVSGFRVDLQAVPADGGVMLTSLLRYGRSPEIGTTTVDLKARISSEGQSGDAVHEVKKIENYKMWSLSSGSSAFLPEGGSIQLAGSYDGKTSPITIRHVSGSLAQRRELELTEGGPRLVLLNEHAGAPSRMDALGAGLLPRLQRPHFSELLGDSPTLGVRFGEGAGPEVFELIGSLGVKRKMGVSYFGPWRILSPRGGDSTGALASYEEQVRATVRKAEPLVAVVDFYLDGELKASYTGSIMSGASTVFGLGVESLDVLDYDVEVAQFAAVADPVISPRFDGITGSLKASIGGDGQLRMELRGVGNWTTEERNFDPGTALMHGVDEATQGRLFVNEKRVVGAGAEGDWEAIFGAEIGKGASMHVQVARP